MTAGSSSSQTGIELTTPVEALPHVDGRRAEALRRLGIASAADLLKHLPMRLEYHAGETAFGQLAEGTSASVTGVIAN